MDTFFAPAGRDAPEDLQRRVVLVENTALLRHMMDAVPTPIVVLNEKRQILMANQALCDLLNQRPNEVVGRRTGEVLGCAYRKEGPDGCGTSRHCLTCGAVAAVLQSQMSRSQATRDCQLTLDTAIDGGARDLRVTATAFEVAGERLSICLIQDVSQQKRLNVLNRVFFHDVLNTAGGIQGCVRSLEDHVRQESTNTGELWQLNRLSDQLIEEIQSQRDLTLAELGDLQIDTRPVHTLSTLQDLRALYARHAVAAGRHIELGSMWDGRLMTDPRLLNRVLANMLKNALEATPVGGTVTMGCSLDGRHVVFNVHNATVMPEQVQLQVFHRSFSTKAASGRGIGTYSMKLLGEHYLSGKVYFTSSESEGTTFFFRLPRVSLGQS
ncbi:MAG: PAS domain-containing protein [Planctomycetes bacterium]|nr:PAS domain-containing protein [Planctomycetota bacterium]